MGEADWEHLKRYGYAPGNYMNKCHTCGKVVEFVDKRAITCRPCAEARHAAAPSPVAQAPAQAGALPHPGSPEASAMMDSMLAEYQHPANSKNAARAGWEAARRWLATQPLAAPVQQEAEAVGGIVGWLESPHGQFRANRGYYASFPPASLKWSIPLFAAIPPAQPVLAPVVREPLTEADVLRIADESDVSRGYEIETTFATAIQRACAEAWGIALTEAAGGIQATTGEQSHADQA